MVQKGIRIKGTHVHMAVISQYLKIIKTGYTIKEQCHIFYSWHKSPKVIVNIHMAEMYASSFHYEHDKSALKN